MADEAGTMNAALVDERTEPLAIRAADLIMVLAAALALSVLLWNYQRVAWWPAAGVCLFIILAPFGVRNLQRRAPDNRVVKFAADFAPIGYVVLLYLNLNPVLDAVNMGIADDWLIRADQRLFGLQPAVALQHLLPPLANDLFLGAYTTYFLWPAALGLVLWFSRRDDAYDEWATALMFFFAVNYAFYAAVPAMGPRYFQSAWFDGPVQGVFLAQHIDLMFRDSPIARDCFPSGHTGVSLMVLVYAWREARRFFWVALVPLTCLIVGTLAGRFHYGIDLVAAIPLMLVSLSVARTLQRRLPAGASCFCVSPLWHVRRTNHSHSAVCLRQTSFTRYSRRRKITST
jgi:hypothetical protein